MDSESTIAVAVDVPKKSAGKRSGERREAAIDLARSEVAFWIGHIDAQDAKAGIILGFSAALVVLGGGEDPALSELVGRFIAAAAAFLAFAAIWPRAFHLPDADYLAKLFLREGEDADGRVLGTCLGIAAHNREAAKRKEPWWKASLVALMLSIIAFVAPTVCTLGEAAVNWIGGLP